MIPRPEFVELNQFFTQNATEFAALLNLMKGSKSILEIGSRYGESLRWFAKACPGAKIVTVDLGNCPDNKINGLPENHVTGDWWNDVCKDISETNEVHQIVGNSHDPRIEERVKNLGPYDFIFIDGDHSIKGVYDDWFRYGPMGKMVAFHDIRLVATVRGFWDVIKKNQRHVEFIEPEGYGIGVIIK